MNSRTLIVAAIVVGVLLLAVAIIYWVEPAGSLPSFFPGHESGSNDHHIKHGIAALVLALGCFAFAWFRSGPRHRGTA
jgi:amino acid permease